MTGQVVVSVPVAKRLIALAIYGMPEVREARERGKIVLKAGTTVAALAELFGVPPLRLGGRIAADGARTAKRLVEAPHIVLIEGGQWRCVDGCLAEELATMDSGDLFITGANALDRHGTAGLMAGLAGGGAAGKALSMLNSEGIQTIVAVGLEKLIPGSIADICRKAGRGRVDRSMGMAVGLLPLFGRVVTEKEALEMMTGAAVTVLGAGGVDGAEGATTMLVEGTEEQVDKAFALIAAQAGRPAVGAPESFASCGEGGYYCARHVGCIYRRRGKGDE
ncbi:hypothetical protein [Anaeroselena agilis]|uniref:Uncharacterized protein n=1 Tax=Anaeroselena agilis TaxID=3063788 RepID=A0ABU3NVP4_9FIRM|nr:hypothetical protein [Selenomonadales bacterium 4137-cl]